METCEVCGEQKQWCLCEDGYEEECQCPVCGESECDINCPENDSPYALLLRRGYD